MGVFVAQNNEEGSEARQVKQERDKKYCQLERGASQLLREAISLWYVLEGPNSIPMVHIRMNESHPILSTAAGEC